MTSVLEGSSLVVDEAFDFFTVPPTNASAVQCREERYGPTASGWEEGDLEFRVEGHPDVCLDLRTASLKFNVKVCKTDGSDLAANDGGDVWPSDIFASSLFSKAEVRFNNVVVESIDDYGIRSFLETRVNSSKEQKKNLLNVRDGWIEDVAVGLNGDTDDDDAKEAIKKRKKMIAEGKELSYCARLHLSTFASDRHLPPNTSLTLRLTRADTRVSLMAETDNPTGGARIKILAPTLILRQITPNPSLLAAYNQKLLEGEQAILPIKRARTQTYGLQSSANLLTVNLERGGMLPNRMLIGLMDPNSIAGTYKNNSFVFKPFNLTHVSLSSDARPSTIAYDVNFTTNTDVSVAYNALAACVGRDDDDRSLDFSLDEWKKHCTIWAFDLTADGKADTFHPRKNATVRLQMRFADTSNEVLTIFVYTESEGLIKFNSRREVRVSDSVL